MKPAIRNWKNMPPAGGWAITIGIRGQTFKLTGVPTKIVFQIAGLQKRNGVFKGLAPIWKYCNAEWCRRDPVRCTIGVSTGSLGTKTKKPPSKLLTCLGYMKALVLNGLKPVPQTLADQRAKICSTCPYNRNDEGCGACVATAKVITKFLIGRRFTPYDKKLKQCGVCGCGLTAKVHYPPNLKDKFEYDDECWIPKEIKNGLNRLKE